MSFKKYFIFALITATLFYENLIYAVTPNLYLIYKDLAGVCKNDQHQTALQLTYKYKANEDFDYFSKIININQPLQFISVPNPTTQGYEKPYIFTDFEISSSGMCGERDLDYANYGSCYLTNILPQNSLSLPYSYKITIIPHATQGVYGPAYNFTCQVEKMSK